MKKIVVTGPECSGKSTLAQALAAEYKVPYVPEYARSYVSLLGRSYQAEDLVSIAKGQAMLEDVAGGHATSAIVCDTGYFVLRIWAQLRFEQVLPEVEAIFKHRQGATYLLCAPDPLWQQDGLRENPHDRWSIFYLYHKYLISSGHPFFVVRGTLSNRLEAIRRQDLF